MEYDELGDQDVVPIRPPTDQGYRTRSECGSDCEPDHSISVEGQGTRIAFVCPDHGVQSIVDPFEDQR